MDAFIDAFGAGYVDLALQLGVTPSRINTIVDRAAAQQHGVKSSGTYDLASRATMKELAELVAAGELEIPIAACTHSTTCRTPIANWLDATPTARSC